MLSKIVSSSSRKVVVSETSIRSFDWQLEQLKLISHQHWALSIHTQRTSYITYIHFGRKTLTLNFIKCQFLNSVSVLFCVCICAYVRSHFILVIFTVCHLTYFVIYRIQTTQRKEKEKKKIILILLAIFLACMLAFTSSFYFHFTKDNKVFSFSFSFCYLLNYNCWLFQCLICHSSIHVKESIQFSKKKKCFN